MKTTKVKKRENAGTKYLNDSNAFIECSNTMDEVYENSDDYNPSRKRKILIVIDEYFTRFYHSVLFFCSKRCEIRFDTVIDYENQQQKRITKYCN